MSSGVLTLGTYTLTHITSGSMCSRLVYTMKEGRRRLICLPLYRQEEGKKTPEKVVSWTEQTELVCSESLQSELELES